MSDAGEDQGVRDESAPVRASGARPDAPRPQTGIAGLIERILALRPVRVFLHYAGDNGPLIASGMTYQAFFALAGALWLGFALLGFALQGNAVLQSEVFGSINRFLPGLIGYHGVNGAVDSGSLLQNATLSWSSAISLLVVLWTAVGFLGTLRTAIRIMFGLPNEQGNFYLLKLRDLGYTIAFGAVVLLTAAITVASNAALGLVLGLLGLPQAGLAQQVATAAVALVLLAAIDSVLLAAAFRILSGIPVPHRRLWAGATIGGAALAVLQTLASTLLHFGTNNPVIKGFAVLVGLLVFFNLVCQLILLAAAWVAVGMLDAGVDASSLTTAEREQDEAARLEAARRLVARANRDALEDRLRAARGLARWRLSRELQREVRAEARRREEVPSTSEYRRAQRRTGDPDPDERQVQRAAD